MSIPSERAPRAAGPGTQACPTIDQAVALAESLTETATTIDVVSATYDEQVTLNVPSGDSISIEGAGASTTTLNDEASGSDVNVEAGTVAIDGMTISGGDAASGWGGGVANSDTGVITLDDDIFESDSAHEGGAVANSYGGSATLDDDVFAGDSGGNGGGFINFSGSATLNDDTFTADSAVDGGAIYNDGPTTLSNSTIANSSASSDGGGIYSYGSTLAGDTFSQDSAADAGGGDDNVLGDSQLTDDTFDGDSATNYDGGGLDIGAGGTGYSVTVDDDTFSFDSAPYGGGVFDWANNTATLTNDTLNGDSAPSGGGAVYTGGSVTLTNDTVSNDSSASGGGIDNGGGAVTLANSVLADNSVGGSCSSAVTDQGYNVADDNTCGLGSKSISNSSTIGPLVLSANSSTGPLTEAITNISSAYYEVPNTFCPATDERGDTRPGVSGGSDCDAGAYELQGTPAASGPTVGKTLYVNPGGSSSTPCSHGSPCPTISDAVNLAEERSDSAVTIDVAPGNYDESLSVDVPARDSMSIQGAGSSVTTLDDNGSGSDISMSSGTASIDGFAIVGGNASTSSLAYGGGAISYSAATVGLYDDVFFNDHAGYGGGGVVASGKATIDDDVFLDDNASYGGGFYGSGSRATANDDVFEGDSAIDGGAIWTSGIVKLTNDAFDSDSASTNGGAVDTDGSSFTLTNDLLLDDSAVGSGGALYNEVGSTTLADDTLAGDSATTYDGGAVVNGLSDYLGTGVTLKNDSLSFDSAPYGGGVFDWAKNTATLTNDTLNGDSARWGGGAVHTGGSVTLTNDTLSNDSSASGGGIDNGGGSVTMANSLLADNSVGGSCSSAVTDQGYNVADDNTCGLGSKSISNSSTIEPLVLSANGSTGPLTEAITNLSSAYYEVPKANCPATDERGDPRPGVSGGSDCDAGAYELQGTALPPKIKDLDPNSGHVGTKVTIYGSYLAYATGVAFNGVAVSTIVSNTNHDIVAEVPTGATTGYVTITTAGGIARSPEPFTVT